MAEKREIFGYSIKELEAIIDIPEKKITNSKLRPDDVSFLSFVNEGIENSDQEFSNNLVEIFKLIEY